MDVSIRKFSKKDIANKIEWINDDRNNRHLHYDLPLVYEKTRLWYERIKERTDRYDAVIEVNSIPVGVAGLLSIDQDNGKAEYYIMMGRQEYKGKGIATEASKLILDYAFERLGLNKVYLFTETENIAAQKLFEKIGFRREGLLEHDLKKQGKSIDRFAYGMNRERYHSITKNNKLVTAEQKLICNPTAIIKSAIQLQQNRIYIKRDDLFPVSFGGNKARKAVLFFKDMEEKGCNCVVTYGSRRSNHCLIVANMAAAKKIPCYIITPSEANKATINSKLVKLFGAVVKKCPLNEVNTTIESVLCKLEREGFAPYFIQGGGHGKIGVQAYIKAYEEIVHFEKANGIYFDYIFLASGTGSTQAGLICGQLIDSGNRAKIVGISNARKNPYGKQVVLESVNGYLNDIGKERLRSDEIIFIDQFIVDGYGSYNEAIVQTILRVLVKDGVPMDTTYTGKGFWGMKEYLKANQIKGKNILFIHTGGTPLFYDNLGELTAR